MTVESPLWGRMYHLLSNKCCSLQSLIICLSQAWTYSQLKRSKSVCPVLTPIPAHSPKNILPGSKLEEIKAALAPAIVRGLEVLFSFVQEPKEVQPNIQWPLKMLDEGTHHVPCKFYWTVRHFWRAYILSLSLKRRLLHTLLVSLVGDLSEMMTDHAWESCAACSFSSHNNQFFY